MNLLDAQIEIRELEVQLRETPMDESCHLRMAEVYFEAGVFTDKALRVYERAVEVRPDHELSQRAMSICFLLQSVGDLLELNEEESAPEEITLDQYCQSIDELLQQLPDSSDLMKTKGDLELLRRCYVEALACYKKALILDPQSMKCFAASAGFASRLADTSVELAMFLGNMLQQIGRPMEAYRMLKQVYDRTGDSMLVDRMIQILEKDLIPHSDPMSVQSCQTDLCALYLDVQDVSEAMRIFRLLDPHRSFRNIRLVKELSMALIGIEDYRSAFDCLSRIPVDDEAKSMLNRIAVALEARGELDTAAYLLQFINRHDLVIQEAERLEEIEIERTAHIELGDLNFKNKRYSRAVENYIKAFSLGGSAELDILAKIDSALLLIDQPEPLPLTRLATYCMDLDEYPRAAGYLKRAYEVAPDDDALRQKLRRCYDFLLKRDPDSPEMLMQSAQLHVRMKEYTPAIEQLEQASTFPERSSEANKRLVRIYMETGSLIRALERAKMLQMNQELQQDIYDLHRAFEDNGELHRAYEAAHLLTEFNENFLDVKDRVGHLQKRMRAMAQTSDSQHSQIRDQKMIELIGQAAVGRYQYIEKLGSGGMGVVNKVYDLQDNKMVAMKILRESLTSSKKAIDRFFREARIAATLNHPNIVNIFDYHINQNDGKSFIAMEFVDGPSLRDMLEERLNHSSELTPDFIAQMTYFMCQLCDALEATHESGIIHRDIKPDNVLVTSDQVVKITDFGIVHIDDATFTPTGALIGTPRYMSPEQVQGVRIDGRSDIYATGIIFYEMLIATPPFISGDIAYQHVHIQPTPMREISKLIPEELDAVVIKCLEKDPEHRYQTAMDLKKDLMAVLEQHYGDLKTHFEESLKQSINNNALENLSDFDLDFDH